MLLVYTFYATPTSDQLRTETADEWLRRARPGQDPARHVQLPWLTRIHNQGQPQPSAAIQHAADEILRLFWDPVHGAARSSVEVRVSREVHVPPRSSRAAFKPSESVVKVSAEVQTDSAHNKSHEMTLAEELDDHKSRLSSTEEEITILKAELEAHKATILNLRRENRMLKNAIPVHLGSAGAPDKDVDMADAQAQSGPHGELVSMPASFTQ